ncbi:antibiotic biosynthesis monooxygenase [Vibrio vulnificus]|jgi:quinol monooxygenase YgiN|uniref:Antibiotic biosynthesis monooxygenase n=2 Tax=Vibrio vulnificus TaxID=672 RepID=A0A2S3SAW7_VIBVL|nr:Hypothetical protein FORC37_4227 [Vibrio vulnificus]OZT82643.1 antibiotic biosynthesis monooxygenase [Vibrio sp. 03_296]POC68751.1 antibiotic biosynthesis monooxygenase [Vibrio vulnificus Env1]AUL98511.1 antibiotic biosynthesis monooxygenase [Vibrio vulnificus]AXX62704.1 antibiotic biosynthesis monooxygenase [Vibrio vulnificus]
MMIHLIAEIKAHADRVDEVRSLLQSLLEPTRQEQGCCQYELFADNQIEGLFLMQEIWCSQQSLDRHIASEHFQRFKDRIEEEELLEYLHLRPLTFVA